MNLRKRFSFIFNVLRLYLKCWCCCSLCTHSRSLSVFLHISVYGMRGVFRNPSAHAKQNAKRAIFMLHLLYLFKNVSRWHLFSQPNYAQKRYVNEVAKRIQYICFAIFLLHFLILSLCFMFFFLSNEEKMRREMQTFSTAKDTHQLGRNTFVES